MCDFNYTDKTKDMMNNKPYDWDNWDKGVEPEELKALTGYNSPIQLILGDFETHMEGECMKAVRRFGFNVDADELKKALEYDRGQYDKGFADGVLHGEKLYAPKIAEWIDGYCGNCGGSSLCDGWGVDVESRFCPNCGAKMKGENDNGR